MASFTGKIQHYFARKLKIFNIYFSNFSGGNTPDRIAGVGDRDPPALQHGAGVPLVFPQRSTQIGAHGQNPGLKVLTPRPPEKLRARDRPPVHLVAGLRKCGTKCYSCILRTLNSIFWQFDILD